MSAPLPWSPEWYDSDPILRRGEPRYDKSTGQLRIGDGATPWSMLNVVESLERPSLTERKAETLATVQEAVANNQLNVTASGTSATQNLLSRLKRNINDATILITGDSTGGKPTDWPMAFSILMANDWPTHTVIYQIWDDAIRAYGPATTIRYGTGPRVLRIFNCSVGGWNTGAPLGARYNNAIEAVNPDLVMISHGHNEEVALGVDYPGAVRGRYLALTETISSTHPAADFVLILQNPASDSDWQAIRADVYTKIAAERGFGVIDVHQMYVDAGKPGAWYADALHPNTLGSQKWAECVFAHFKYRASVSPITRATPGFLTVGQNLLLNPNFVGFASTTPDSWVRSANALTIKATAADDRETKDWAVRLYSNGLAPSHLSQTLSPTQLRAARGGWLTLAVRVKLNENGDVAKNRIGIAVTGGQTVLTPGPTQGLGGWRWLVACTYVPANATAILVILYADSGSTNTGDMLIDRAILTRGSLPRDMALT